MNGLEFANKIVNQIGLVKIPASPYNKKKTEEYYMLELIKKFEELNNDELRNLLIEKSDDLDSLTDRLQKMYGLEIPENELVSLEALKEDVKALEFIIIKRFKTGKIK